MMFELIALLAVWHVAVVLLGAWYAIWRYQGAHLTLQSLSRRGIYTTLGEPVWRREGKREGYFVMIAQPNGHIRLLYCGYYVPPPRWTVHGIFGRYWETVPSPPENV